MNDVIVKVKAMITLLEDTVADAEKFEAGNKSAGTRVRASMQSVKTMAQDIRVAVQEAKNA